MAVGSVGPDFWKKPMKGLPGNIPGTHAASSTAPWSTLHKHGETSDSPETEGEAGKLA